MIQNFYHYQPNLPQTISSKERFNEAYERALNAVQQAKVHWSALLSIKEIKEPLRDINKALDEREEISLSFSEKIKEVEALPLPSNEKAKLLQEWQKLKAETETHLTALEEAFDTLPCGYMEYEENKPETLRISDKNLKEYATQESLINVPNEAIELYSKFLAAIQAINEFHQYEREKNLNERDFISILGHIHNSEEFASNYVFGTWKKFH